MPIKISSLLLIAFLFVNAIFAQKSKETEDPPATYELTYNGTKYTIKEGDTVSIGYGSNPFGSFMYMKYGGDKSLPKEVGGKTAIITKIKHYKLGNIDRITFKTTNKPAWRFYTDDLNQAIGKQEILRINDVKFHE